MAVLAKYGFGEVTGAVRSRLSVRLGDKTEPSQVEPVVTTGSRPARVRMALEELGPTFIKLGQLLSTRPDLISPDYIKELEHLQDQVAPDSPDKIMAQLKHELGDGRGGGVHPRGHRKATCSSFASRFYPRRK